MSFSERYHKILEMIKLASNAESGIVLEELLKEASILFQDFAVEYYKAPEEEKADLMRLMQDLKDQIEETSRKIMEQTGVSEEELQQISSKHELFTPFQSAWLDRAEKSASSAGGAVERAQKPLEKPSISPSSKAEPKKKTRVKRSRWLKS